MSRVWTSVRRSLTDPPFSAESQIEAQAEKPDRFVPIQIDLDVDTFKIRDAFVWNANGECCACADCPARDLTPDFVEKLIGSHDFARIFCDDLDLPQSYAEEVAAQIARQVAEQAGVAEVAVRSAQEEADDAERDLRVVLNVRD